jgi:ubiquitin carboxyl-terminal hydrolase 4/11/15
LHEELNLRKEKPFIENPDSDNRDEKELGLQVWSNMLRRDWSFIFFLFQGQLKSSLKCHTCGKLSITFDNFTSIPLSLPEPSKILINIIVYRLPDSLRELMAGRLNRDGDLNHIDTFRSDEDDA